MTSLARLSITNIRNIANAELLPVPGFNLYFGDNGSGKTSILEAVHLLGLGRSFRGHLQKPLIREGQSEATVFGETMDGLGLGLQRPARGLPTIHIAGRKADSLAELSQLLPVQLINTDTFKILEGSPQERRRFLDWGVFHVEHSFLPAWRRSRLALQNRNSLLKQNAPAVEIEPWTQELVRNAEQIDQLRSSYLLSLRKILAPFLASVGEAQLVDLSLGYDRGWAQELSLAERLQQDMSRDRKQGFTGSGPHRADVHFRLGNNNAADVLSRGQLKLLVSALKIAQGQLLLELRGQHCIYLIDDLPAELDAVNRSRVCELLKDQGAQVFLTCIEREMISAEVARISREAGADHKLFHVKHGSIDVA